MKSSEDLVVYFNGDVLPKRDVRISPDDRGFLFADGIYEVARIYDGVLFAAEAHWTRMARSLRALRIEGPDPARFTEVAEQLMAANDVYDGALYVQITRGAAPRSHPFPPADTPPTVYATVYRPRIDPQKWEEGVAATLVSDNRWARCDIKTVALPPNVLASQRALEKGVEEALFVRDGVVLEGSHTNLAAVLDGELVTYPKSNYILPGITRDLVLELCRDLAIPYREEALYEHELDVVSELMILGTTTEVMPVVEVDGRPVGDGRPGPVTRRLQAAFRELTHPAHAEAPRTG